MWAPAVSPSPSCSWGPGQSGGRCSVSCWEGWVGWLGEGGLEPCALCSGGWRMVPTPSIIWQPLALRLTRPLRPETECSISSEPSPPTSPLPLARLLSEPRSGSSSWGWGEQALGNTQRNAQTWETLIIQGYIGGHTDPLGQRHLESQMERGHKSRDMAHM